MKRSFLLLLVSTLSMSLMASMCSSDDDGMNPSDSNNISELEDITQTGAWSITYYIDSGDDETNHFTNYTFTFNTDGTLVATNGDTTVNGTWSITNDSNSSDDDDNNSSSDTDFNIFFASPPNFEDLTDDWDIIEITNSKIELIDVSGGNGGTDYLTFTKQ